VNIEELEEFIKNIRAENARPWRPTIKDTALANVLKRFSAGGNLSGFLASGYRRDWIESFKGREAELTFLLLEAKVRESGTCQP
jgi:hypothetical protein